MGVSPSYVPVQRNGQPATFTEVEAETLTVSGAASAETLTVSGAASAETLTVSGETSVQGLTVHQPASMNDVHAAATTATQLTVSGSTTLADLAVSGTATIGTRLVDAEWVPADHGLEAWTHDPGAASSSVTVVTGRIYAVRIPVRRAFTLARVWWALSTPGAGPVAGQSWVGVADASGTVLASAGVDAQVTGSGAQGTALTATLAPPYVRVLFLFNAATAPGLVRGSSFETTPNVNLPTAGLRAATVASGATALPATFDPSTLTTSGSLTLFAALESA